jgi:hypothetical protein
MHLLSPIFWLKMLRHTAQKLSKFYMRKYHSMKYLYFRGKNQNGLKHSVHLLVVKNRKYAHLAKICAESFIYNNTKSKVTIHCDEKTYEETKRQLKVLIAQGKADVILDQVSPSKSWQVQKLSLILNFCGTEEIFMDADLKWNGKLDYLTHPTFFFEEFSLEDSQFFSTVLRNLFPEFDSFGTMKNTSFFTWHNFAITEFQKNEIIKFNENVTEYAKKHRNINEHFVELERISEQLVLSFLSENWKVKLNFLKDADDIFDGRFVESSYFGATGGEF